MPYTAMTVVEVQLTSRLGQLAIAWAVIEAWLNHVLAAQVNADPGAMTVITDEMGGGMVIQHIKTLISVHEHKQPDLSEVRELIDRADEIRIERNLLIHGLWDPTGCEPGTCLVQTSKWKRTEVIREWLVTTTDIDQLLADCDNWIQDFVATGRKFGFPRRQGESKSIFADWFGRAIPRGGGST